MPIFNFGTWCRKERLSCTAGTTKKDKLITFKEFVEFCNERASDGCWNFIAAIQCTEIINDCNHKTKVLGIREKYFQENYGKAVDDFVKKLREEIAEKKKNKIDC